MDRAIGLVVIKAPEHLIEKLTCTNHLEKVLGPDAIRDLLAYAEINIEESLGKPYTYESPECSFSFSLEECEFRFRENSQIKGDYIVLGVNGGNWVALTHLLATQGKNIEIYADLMEHYGEYYFFALNHEGLTKEFCIYHDENPEEDYDEDSDIENSPMMKELYDLLPPALSEHQVLWMQY